MRYYPNWMRSGLEKITCMMRRIMRRRIRMSKAISHIFFLEFRLKVSTKDKKDKFLRNTKSYAMKDDDWYFCNQAMPKGSLFVAILNGFKIFTLKNMLFSLCILLSMPDFRWFCVPLSIRFLFNFLNLVYLHKIDSFITIKTKFQWI